MLFPQGAFHDSHTYFWPSDQRRVGAFSSPWSSPVRFGFRRSGSASRPAGRLGSGRYRPRTKKHLVPNWLPGSPRVAGLRLGNLGRAGCPNPGIMLPSPLNFSRAFSFRLDYTVPFAAGTRRGPTLFRSPRMRRRSGHAAVSGSCFTCRFGPSEKRFAHNKTPRGKRGGLRLLQEQRSGQCKSLGGKLMADKKINCKDWTAIHDFMPVTQED